MEEDRQKALRLFEEGQRKGLPASAIAGLLGICTRSLRRWGHAFVAHGFSKDGRKGSQRQVSHRFSDEERGRLVETINNPRFADLHPGQIVAILAEEKDYVGSESTIYRIMRQEGLINHRGRSRPPREKTKP